MRFLNIMKTEKKFYVYIILTVNNTLYCGYTDNVEKRYKLHCSGRGAKYTKANKPLKLVYIREFKTKQEAQKEEYRIKNLTRKQKELLFNSETLNIKKYQNILNSHPQYV